jgi:acyl-CoA synthetase (AMP-forming)/AMP-acid ligase II
LPVDVTTFPGLVRRNTEKYGAERAIVTADDAITYAELDAQSRSVAAGLYVEGVSKGTRVGLLAPNGIDWAVAATAVMRMGAVLVPLSTLLRPPELEEQLRLADVAHLIAIREFRGRTYLDEIPDVPTLRNVWPLDELICSTAYCGLEGVVRPADDLVVLFTSGSRGAPKGCIHTHASALRAVASGLDARRIAPGERVYIPMPFFWTGGFASGLMSTLVAGATLLTEAIPEPDHTLALLERERVTLFRGWPDQAARLAAHPRFADADLSSLGPGSLPAVLPPELRPAPGARANLFGMTETCGPYVGARLDLDLPEDKRGSLGQAFEGYEVQIFEPDHDGVGEIRLRGPNMLRAICGRTREETFDEDGHYATGDLGRLDGDGYLWFHGRADDMFKVKGATVYPSEVEAALRAVPGVQQAHVTDIDGEVGVLVVSARSQDELRTAARERLSAFKVPTRWLITDDAHAVPMTATDKVDKAALQALLRKGSGA